ncbi:mRNA interferase MazF [Parabacteroides sp. PF5-5]|uniref:type II toxin-antitoxin system PemK/MazF family toxin n=1 Tax=unclassified Parabacteroides TaxID=2649774 RepID=UPI00247496F1|nr:MULTISPECIES: type II toxin-antitoxin system PemK/MazF family toxin [unclassified Parabacteroides]MDH6303886.1 mRNA interferase MazF [Parabacteroides sp. PH5-39]MDH6314503.1 mRNA interferase MazF [Parabacteroides sp. PF5-13]MDH6318432.1 mRNA interferase MazF [Parabacteroides sp. PH5-13]MDH6322275.1 mRNA interferase MazF [Parabacteroides sp. PH5-8]MDH6325645.1 mRNA interferase MazF [Parabacteroides sp. PH5-41]
METHTGNSTFICKQYEIVMINLDPLEAEGEIRNKQICLLLSPDEMNKHLDYVEVVPLTPEHKHIPTRVKLSPTKKSSITQPMYVVLDQKKTILSKRVICKIGDITEKEKEAIFNTLVEMYRY